MTADEAIAVIEALLNRSLMKVEELLLRGVWEGYSYTEIGKQGDYDPSYIKLASYKLWQDLSTIFDEKVSKSNLQTVVKRHQRHYQPKQTSKKPFTALQQNLGSSIDVSHFFGRIRELTTLEQWMQERCRLLFLLGIGGVGKTSLAVTLAEEMQSSFQYISLHSLRPAKPLRETLPDILKFLANQEQTLIPKNLSEQISLFLDYLQRYRCLIILDGFEALFQNGNYAGKYHLGLEDYGELLKRVGEAPHQSCLIVTSREKPLEIVAMEGESLPVRVLQIRGLDEASALEILKTKLSHLPEADVSQLVQCYHGIPLALKIAATSIIELFDGNIAEFLEQKIIVVQGIRNLLDEHCHRLSSLELRVMFWLAINRSPVSVTELQADIVPPVAKLDLLEALESLRRRSLIEKNAHGFTLQSLLMEYVTNELVQKVYEEISSQEIEIRSFKFLESSVDNLQNYALLKATQDDKVRASQLDSIMQPLLERLLSAYESKQTLAERLLHFKSQIQSQDHVTSRYAIANLSNLLTQLNSQQDQAPNDSGNSLAFGSKIKVGE